VRLVELRRQRCGHIRPLPQRFLVVCRHLKYLFAFLGTVIANQLAQQREHFHIPRIGRIQPSRPRKNQAHHAIGMAQNEV
jgi:hypothetical protein